MCSGSGPGREKLEELGRRVLAGVSQDRHKGGYVTFLGGDSEKLRVSEISLRVFLGREKQAPQLLLAFLVWPR